MLLLGLSCGAVERRKLTDGAVRRDPDHQKAVDIRYDNSARPNLKLESFDVVTVCPVLSSTPLKLLGNEDDMSWRGCLFAVASSSPFEISSFYRLTQRELANVIDLLFSFFINYVDGLIQFLTVTAKDSMPVSAMPAIAEAEQRYSHNSTRVALL